MRMPQYTFCAVGIPDLPVAPHTAAIFGPLDVIVDLTGEGFTVVPQLVACARHADAVVVHWNSELAPRFAFLCHRLRSPARPIVAVTGGSGEDHTLALISGADTVVAAPPLPAVLQAEAIAHRRGRAAPANSATLASPPPADEVRWGPLAVSVDLHRATVDGRPIALTPRQVRLLAILAARPGVPIARDRLLHDLWGVDFDPETNVVDVTVHRLRAILRAAGAGDVVRTVRGVGYTLGDPA